MPFAVGSRSSLGIVAETSFGVTPTTPTFAEVPLRSHSLTLSKERMTGADITADRMLRVDRHGNSQVGGSIEVDLRKGDYDLLIESAFFNTFATDDTISVGTTLHSVSMEDAALDIGQYRLFTGLVASSMSVSLGTNQMAQATFEMVGKGMTQASSSASASAYTAASTNEPFSADCKGTVSIDGSPVGYVSALEFSISNDVTPAFSLGSCEAQQLAYDMATVAGTLTMYYVDAAVIDAFINETSVALTMEIDDPTGSNGYTFLFPRIKYNGATVPVADGKERFIEVPFVALKDDVTETNLTLTRSS